MKTMGTENPNRANFPPRSAATPFPPPPPPQNAMPFLSSGPVVGSEASAFRPTPPTTPQTTMHFLSSGPVIGTEAPGFRPTPPARSNDPSVLPPPSSYAPPAVGTFQRFPMPQFPSTAQLPPPSNPPPGPPVLPPPFKPPAGHVSSPPVSLHPQPHVPSVPMGSPPQSISPVPSSMNVRGSSLDSLYSFPRPTLQPSSPPMESSYPTARATLQSTFPGYPSKLSNGVPQAPPVQSAAFLAHQGGYVPPPPASSSPFLAHQGGYVPPPTAAAPLAPYSREQMQHPGSGPPMGSVQGLIEDFSSLSLGSVPGSMDPGLDTKALPRPLEGDVEPSSFAKMYPMNCNSRYLRLTTSAIPSSQSLGSRWHLPLGAVLCPLAEAPDGEEVPIVNFATTGIIRCRRCRTYVNPYVTFTDGGRKWRCNICALLNDVPGDYFANLDASGRRIDLDQRPELTKGSVEFIAPAEYMVRPPMPPLYFFLIDVSISAVRSGMLEVVAQTIKSCLDRLPGCPRTQIGFITFDSTIHFYNMKSSLTQPQMMVVSDLDDTFVPLPDDLLVNLSESRSVVEAFLDSLPSMFQDNMNVESSFGPALKAAFMVMSQLGGKLLIFQNTLPSLGVGRLRLRGDDLRVYGT
ncbi:hypothetical protein F0562_014106 [Nyssa sinensis]|uniref:Zinc finger Sec23/Sec24-type domain-containing protein n=1 Tax=Nyssa sinensis TaxID=561372 RepID=A0A5J4ZPM3_9ASTE|nr:hypothetical protein F0562_014106 [Nyssa sinensis]